jgi:ActR/RegA family two-component response regulator
MLTKQVVATRRAYAPGLRRRLLIVEDDLRPGRALKAYFEKVGFESVLCQDLRLARQSVEGTYYTVILADVHVGDETAVEFLRYARKCQPASLLIGMSGVASSTYVDLASLVCDEFFHKPVDNDALHSQLLGALEQRLRALREALLQSVDNSSEQPQSPIGAPMPSSDPNVEAFVALDSDTKQQLNGQYAAFWKGKFVGADSDRDRLIKKVYQETRDLDMLVQKVEPDPRVVRFRRPRRISSTMD